MRRDLRHPSCGLAIAVLSAALLGSGPLWAAPIVYQPGDEHHRQLEEKMRTYAENTPARRAFNELMQWNVFRAGTGRYLLEGGAIKLIEITTRTAEGQEQTWRYYPQEGEPGGLLRLITPDPANPGAQENVYYVLRNEGGTVSASRDFRNFTYSARLPQPSTSGTTPEEPTTPTPPRTPTLEPAAPPAQLRIAPRGSSPSSEHDYYWSGENLLRVSDNSEFGYMVRGSDLLFVHSGYQPEANGNHPHEARTWALYSTGGKKLGAYVDFDLVRSQGGRSNVVTVQEGGAQVTRLRLSESLVSIQEYSRATPDAPPVAHQGLQLLQTQTSPQGPLYTRMDLNAVTYRDEVVTPTGGRPVIRAFRVPEPSSSTPPPIVRRRVSADTQTQLAASEQTLSLERLRALLATLLTADANPSARWSAAHALRQEVLRDGSPRSEQLAVAEAFRRLLRPPAAGRDPLLTHEMQATLDELRASGRLLT